MISEALGAIKALATFGKTIWTGIFGTQTVEEYSRAKHAERLYQQYLAAHRAGDVAGANAAVDALVQLLHQADADAK